MLLGKPRSAWSARTVARYLRGRAEHIRAILRIDFGKGTLGSYYQVAMLRPQIRFARREATQFAQNPVIHGDPEVRELFDRIDRDYELLGLVATRDNVSWSVYQLEEIDAILERIARNYARAADCLTPVAS
jgi:hypothetical protein